MAIIICNYFLIISANTSEELLIIDDCKFFSFALIVMRQVSRFSRFPKNILVYISSNVKFSMNMKLTEEKSFWAQK